MLAQEEMSLGETRWVTRTHRVFTAQDSSAITFMNKMSELGDPAVIPSFRHRRRSFLMDPMNKVLLTLVPFLFYLVKS